MTTETWRGVFLWCIVMNMGLLLWWFILFAFAHDWIYRMHSRWFKIPVETFNAIHYAGMAFFKIAIFIFNITPYAALLILVK
ncbi:MAG: hypothetical protein JW774_01970 [Candidatus Aureabacteria bacterium]|nr:hypothetical protein [Candidatus Auribacterota bacterium]